MSLFAAQHPQVRDLVWAVASPPLVVADQATCQWYTADWYRQQALASSGLFADAEQYPDALESAVAADKDRRLGKYFETLWAYWLQHSAHYDIVARNLAIRDGSDTLGELDLVVFDKIQRRTWHWELAVKFYLGTGSGRQQAQWLGPNQRDRLDRKLAHLRQRQSQLSQQPRAREVLADQGIAIDACGVILKGRLYYPLFAAGARPPAGASAEHIRAHWCRFSDLAHTEPQLQWLPLPGSGWLADIVNPQAQCYQTRAILNAIAEGEYQLPLQLAQIQKNTQIKRLFIVPDHWIHDLAQELF